MSASWTKATLQSEDMIVLTSDNRKKNRKHAFLGLLMMTCFVSDVFLFRNCKGRTFH